MRLMQRAKIVLLAAEGKMNQDIAADWGIMPNIAEHNKAPKAIVWTAQADVILDKVRRAMATLGNVNLNEAPH